MPEAGLRDGVTFTWIAQRGFLVVHNPLPAVNGGPRRRAIFQPAMNGGRGLFTDLRFVALRRFVPCMYGGMGYHA